MSRTEILTCQLSAIECPECGILTWLTTTHEQRLRRSHELFYCPNGHSQLFRGESDAERLKRELATAQGNLSYAREQRDRAERSASAYKGQVTKVKNRIRAGVCPCCNRTFQNLAKHMAGQHPDYGVKE